MREAVTKLQAIIIAIIIIIAVIAGIAAYTFIKPSPTPSPSLPSPTPSPSLPSPTPSPSLPSPTPSPSLPSEIRVGTVEFLSGPLAVLGEYAVLGLKIGVQWVNDQGGVNIQGKKIPMKLIYYDCESDVDYAIKLTEKLIVEDKIHFFFPPINPVFVVATVPVVDKHNIVSFSVGAGSEEEIKQGFKYMIQYGFMGYYHYLTALKLVREVDPEAKTMAFISSAMDTGGGFIKAVHTAAQKYNFKIIYEKVYPEDIADASPMLREIAALKPDVLVGGTFPTSGMLITSQLRDLRIYIKWIILDMVINKVEFGQMFGKYAVGFFLDSPYEPEVKWEIFAEKEGKEYIGPTNDEVLRYWREMGRSERIRTEVGLCVPAAVLVKKCVELAQSLDPDDIMKAALSLDVYTCKGPFKLDPTNPSIQVAYGQDLPVVQWQKQDNKLVYAVVYPLDFATGTLIPMPSWEEKDTWPELMLEIS